MSWMLKCGVLVVLRRLMGRNFTRSELRRGLKMLRKVCSTTHQLVLTHGLVDIGQVLELHVEAGVTQDRRCTEQVSVDGVGRG